MAERNLEDYSAEELAQMAGTYNALLSNPETREVALRLTKKVNPQLSIPEVDLKDQARAEFKRMDDRHAALENEIRMRDARDRINNERASLRGQGFNDDDIAEIEKVMTTEQIPSYQTAATYYKNARQVAQPTPGQGGVQQSSTYELPNDALAAMKNGKAGISKWSRGIAESAMAELRAGQIKLH